VKLPAEALAEGCAALGLSLTAEQHARLLRYLALLQKWNRVYNLTAIRDEAKLVSHHLLDSLAVVPHLRGHRVLDVGTGAGLPGIAIAVASPAVEVVMLDSNHKKLAFVTQAVGELGLSNASVERTRVEQWHPARGFDTVISRAFAELPDFARLAGHLLAPGGRLLAMKGLHPHEEIAGLPEGFSCEQVLTLKVPGMDARHLVVVKSDAAGGP
jgi:16S rRNA (guanine527-N7)-methyltransferase